MEWHTVVCVITLSCAAEHRRGNCKNVVFTKENGQNPRNPVGPLHDQPCQKIRSRSCIEERTCLFPMQSPKDKLGYKSARQKGHHWTSIIMQAAAAAQTLRGKSGELQAPQQGVREGGSPPEGTPFASDYSINFLENRIVLFFSQVMA